MSGSNICSSRSSGRCHSPSVGDDVLYYRSGVMFTAPEHFDTAKNAERYIAVRECRYCSEPIYTRNLLNPRDLNWDSWTRNSGEKGWFLFNYSELFTFIIVEEPWP